MPVINRNSAAPIYDTLADAIAGNMRVGQQCIVQNNTGSDDVTTNYKVVANGSGGIAMNNGNELLGFGYDKVASISQLPPAIGSGRKVSVTSYRAGWAVVGDGLPRGGGEFVDAGLARHNGGTIIDPNRTFPTDWDDEAQKAAWFADSGVDVNCFVRTTSEKLTPADFGAFGDCVITRVSGNNTYTGTNDAKALNALLANAKHVILAGDVAYNFGGEQVNVPNGVFFDSSKSVKLCNGLFKCQVNGGFGNKFGDLSLYDVSTVLGASNSLEVNHYRGMVIGNIYLEGNEGISLLYHNNLTCGDITINALDDNGVEQQVMALGGIFESTIGNISLSGYYGMGLETIVSDGYSTRNTTIKSLFSNRNPAATTSPGHHSFYVRHNLGLKIGSIYSTGYSVADALSSSFCLKFRDNHRCEVDSIYATTVQFASDANSTILNTLAGNKIGRVDTRTNPALPDEQGYIAFTIGGAGEMGGNTIGGLYSTVDTSGTIPIVSGYDSAFTFSGIFNASNTGNITLSSMRFDGADVTYAASETAQYTRELLAKNTTFNGSIETINRNIELINCECKGDVYLNCTSGTYQFTMKSVTVDGNIYASVFSTRVVNATWWNVTCGQPRVSDVNFRPDGVLDYKSVFFQDGYYLDQTTFVTPYV